MVSASTDSRIHDPDQPYAPPSYSAVRPPRGLSSPSAPARAGLLEAVSRPIAGCVQATLRLSLVSQASDRPCSTLLESRRPESRPPACRKPAPRPSLNRILQAAT